MRGSPQGRGGGGRGGSPRGGGRGRQQQGGGGRSPGGRGRGGAPEPAGPPQRVEVVGEFMHACEGEAVCKLTHQKVPFFNGPIYLENKSQIGKVDEIFGPINSAYFTVKMAEGVVPSSYSPGDKFYIAPEKLLPMERFLPKPKGSEASKGPGAGGGGPQKAGGGGRGRGSPGRGGGGRPGGSPGRGGGGRPGGRPGAGGGRGWGRGRGGR